MTWAYTYDPHVWPPIITAVFTVLLGWYGWQRRHFPGSFAFTFLCLFSFLWALGAIFETSATDFTTRVLWIKFQAIWQIPAATALPWFVMEFTGANRWLSRRNLVLFFSPSLVTILLIISNDYHHLIWTGFQMEDHIVQSFGIANWILMTYAFLMIFNAVLLLSWLAIRSSHIRRPALIMLSGMVIGFGFYALANTGVVTLGPGERVMVVLGPLSVSYALAFLGFRVLDPVPMARTAVLDQMSEGVLVLDKDGRIASTNAAADQILGKSARWLRGKPASDLLQVAPEVLSTPSSSGASLEEISLGKGTSARHFSLNLTRLTDRTGRVLGGLLLLHDVTGEKKTREQLVRQQRVVATLEERERLARELHDGIGQVLGYMGMQAQTARKLVTDGDAEKADALLGRLTEVARDAHADVRGSIFGLKAGQADGWSFISALKQYLARFQDNYGIHTELDLSGETLEAALSPEAGVQLMRVVQEALTNSRKHSQAHNISVSVGRKDGHIVLSVTDDGAGFDAGSSGGDGHFGLSFMDERMKQIGGSMEIKSKAGEGTVVSLAVPLG